jgi:hypothetical protein
MPKFNVKIKKNYYSNSGEGDILNINISISSEKILQNVLNEIQSQLNNLSINGYSLTNEDEKPSKKKKAKN